MTERRKPQAFESTYASRLRIYHNTLLTPVFTAPAATTAPSNERSRTTKRGTTIINYAEDGFDDLLLDDDSDTPRRRQSSIRAAQNLQQFQTHSLHDQNSAAAAAANAFALLQSKYGKEVPPLPETLDDHPSSGDELDPQAQTTERKSDDTTPPGPKSPFPLQTVAIWRDWMGKNRFLRSDNQNSVQADLPLAMIPIRVDVDIPAHMIDVPPTDLTTVSSLFHNPPNRPKQEQTPAFRLRDYFLWNLHEALITPDQFALTLVQDLDLPNRQAITADISRQIRTQLEEYAGVVLHPLFQRQYESSRPPLPSPKPTSASPTPLPTTAPTATTTRANSASQTPRETSLAPDPSMTSRAQTPLSTKGGLDIKATAQFPSATTTSTLEIKQNLANSSSDSSDDDYRCIIQLSFTLDTLQYTDRFEWSLLYPPGTAEMFARQTCQDVGLSGEWIPAVTHAIYEAELRLKKEILEAGGLPIADFANGAYPSVLYEGGEEAGWRYDPAGLCEDWAPMVEILTKEEVERREVARERDLRRLRRETSRISSTAGLSTGFSTFGQQQHQHGLSGSHTTGGGISAGELAALDEDRLGRGERSRRRRATSPGGIGTPLRSGGLESGGGGGGSTGLSDPERTTWRCSHCLIWGNSVWAVRDGPKGRRSLCHACGLLYEQTAKLPFKLRNLHASDVPF